MKKVFGIFLVAILIVTMCLPVSAMKAVGEVATNYGSVVIDGNFSEAKWANAAKLTIDGSNAKAWVGETIETTIILYTLWNESGLYMAGDIKDPTFTPAEATYSGDSFQISLDIGQILMGSGESRAIFYSWSCVESGTMSRQESANNAEVADGEDGFIIKTNPSASGWTFEIFMPWTMLVEDMNLKSGKTFAPAPGAKINALVCYLDAPPFWAAAFGTTKTDENTAFDWGPDDHGITFVLQAEPPPPVVEEIVEEEPAVVEETPAVTLPAVVPQTGNMLAGSVFLILASAFIITVAKKRK